MTGTLHLVGVGPGDPELLTLKAARILGSTDVVAFPRTGDGATMALDIAAPHVNQEAERLPVHLPILVERAPAQAAYDRAAVSIGERLVSGRSVAFLCEGDPLFYGSAMYLLDRLGPEAKVEVVPGVTSLTAAAAAIPRALVRRNDILKVLPAPLPDDSLDAELRGGTSLALIKVGRHYDRVRGLIERAGRLQGAVLVEEASTATQRVSRLSTRAPGDPVSYFSMILCPAREELA